MALSQNIKSKHIVVIDTERCKGCCFCISVCPKKVIEVATNINQNGYAPAEVLEDRAFECTGCISCAVMCPDTAISVYRHNHSPGQPTS